MKRCLVALLCCLGACATETKPYVRTYLVGDVMGPRFNKNQWNRVREVVVEVTNPTPVAQMVRVQCVESFVGPTPEWHPVVPAGGQVRWLTSVPGRFDLTPCWTE